MAKILVMTSTFPRWEGDSVPPFVYYLSAGLAAKGHEVHVLAPHTRGAPRKERLGSLYVYRFRYAPARLEFLCYDGGMLENLKRRPVGWVLLPVFLAAELLALLRLAGRHKVDIVHAHWFLPQGLVSALAKPFLRRPILMTAHGADVFSARSPLRRHLFRRAARAADACTVNSSSMQVAFSHLTGRTPQVIPMGVDVTQFRPVLTEQIMEKGTLENGPRVIFVGRLAEKKGVKHLVHAMTEVQRASPCATLTVVGDGPERPMLEALGQQLGLEEDITFAGAVPNEHIPDYLRAADVFVAPSVVTSEGDTEALGVVLLEAAACGVPIVASDVGGICDVVRHDETGLLVEPESPGQIARAVIRLAQDAPLRARLAAQAREHVVREFSWESVIQRFNALIQELTAAKSPGSQQDHSG